MATIREELIYLLNEAAEIEHAMACQYLFAAFSLKKDVSEGVTWDEMKSIRTWGQTIFLISREEMSHLGIVCNLLTSLGASPRLGRRNFPFKPGGFSFPVQLTPFSEDTVKKFICMERPDGVHPEDSFCFSPLTAVALDLTPKPVPYKSVGELYDQIRKRIADSRDRDLFIGPADAQVASSPEMGLEYPDYNILRRGTFDVVLVAVSDRASALAALDRIIEQGEGAPGSGEPKDEPSHFERLLVMLRELEALKKAAAEEGRVFEPARDVVHNPALYGSHAGLTVIQNQDARDVLDVFNACYQLLLLILVRFYSNTDETASDIVGLRYMLFPMMSMCIRPLGEVLTEMPAFDHSNAKRCGPGFELTGEPQFLPHRLSAWKVLIEQTKNAAERCREIGKKPGMPARLAYIAETTAYMATRFQTLLTTGNVAGAEHIF